MIRRPPRSTRVSSSAASDVYKRQTEYCSELYNYKANGDPSVLNCLQTDTGDDHPILRGEVEAAVQSLKKGKSAGVDNIPAELFQAGGEDVITALTTICNKIWQTGEWATPWTQSLAITLPKKGNLQQCQNYRSISLISHPSKVMLKIILNRLKPQAEKIIAEEQGGFRAGRSTTEQIFNLRILCEKYLQHRQDIYHVFMMTNNTSGINTDIEVNRQKLETVTSFKFLGSVITEEGSKPEILSRIVQTLSLIHI